MDLGRERARWGGPVPTEAYCCAAHSLVGTRADVIATAAGALAAWRTRVEELARIFDELAATDEPVADAAVRAATRLLPVVLEWTGAEDAWYATFATVVRWALERRGVDPAEASTWVEASTRGHFESWMGPSPAAVTKVLEILRDAASREPTPTTDATKRWLSIRSEVRGRKRLYTPSEVCDDGHLRLIETFDASRGPIRADRMRRALASARADAEAGHRLTVERLQHWQSIVLDGPAPLRTLDAFAHGGRERYGVEKLGELDRFLDDANAPDFVISRAARAYLDVCFFHPFEDGNARSARLALDFVLWREGLALHAMEPIALVARRPFGRADVHSFVYVVDYFAGARSPS
ncbi:MAG: Fic family protein [Myxococcales bacterium]|nr:Fic family protein [Myxococcales bacterium]